MTATERLHAGLPREAAERLADGAGVDAPVPGGRLYLDRPLPFLCVYRGEDRGAAQLVQSEGAWLVASPDPSHHEPLSHLVTAVLDALADQFGAVLLLEVWPAAAAGSFTVVASETPDALSRLVESLAAVRFAGQRVGVDVHQGDPAPPDLRALLGPDDVRRLGCLHVGLGVPARYRDPTSGALLPLPLRTFRRELSRALQQTFHRFAQVQTSYHPPHYRTLGRRDISDAALHADARLADIAASVDFLLAVTPVNTHEAWKEFEADRYRRAPQFHYRLLDHDPDVLKRRLYEIPIERVPDPTLAYLLRDKRSELDRRITLVADRDTPRFLPGSVALYGAVDDELYDLAERTLAGLPTDYADVPGDDALDARAFAALAAAELDRYARDHPPAGRAAVRVRDDVHTLVVSGAQLLVGSTYRVHPRRAEALVQHEVGTHILTHLNGAAQPLRLLADGLAGYEQLQEGLAVFAEHLAGGLTPGRLRLLAARVLAVRRLTEGIGFTDVFHELHTYGLPASAAFSVTARVFRSGGLTKDAVYLRGLAGLLTFLAGGGDIRTLLLGKMNLDHVPLVEELRWREVLSAPPLTPAWLERPDALARLDRAGEGMDVLDLIGGTSA